MRDPLASASPRLGTAPVFSVLQHNCLGSWDVFLSLFNSFGSDIPFVVCLQDPPVWRGRLPSADGFVSFCPPSVGRKPRVAFYVLRSIMPHVSIFPVFFPGQVDVAKLEIRGPSLFGSDLSHFDILNVYNTWSGNRHAPSLSPERTFPPISVPTLVVGDFNIHHPSADPLRTHSPAELRDSFPYFSRAADLGYSLLNVPGVYTRFPFDALSRPAVLDRAFAYSAIASRLDDWSTPLPSTGSDHVPVLLRFSHPLAHAPPPSHNWPLTDWPTLEPLLASTSISEPPPAPTRELVDAWFSSNLDRVTPLLRQHTPVSRPSPRAKPWCSPLLSTIRGVYNSAARVARTSRTPDDSEVARSTRNGYFKAFKVAKNAHWRS